VDERDMQEEAKDKKGKGWGKQMLIYFWNSYFYVCNYQSAVRKPGEQIKHLYLLLTVRLFGLPLQIFFLNSSVFFK
jgi:hypothetical protein